MAVDTDGTEAAMSDLKDRARALAERAYWWTAGEVVAAHELLLALCEENERLVAEHEGSLDDWLNAEGRLREQLRVAETVAENAIRDLHEATEQIRQWKMR